MVSKYISIWQTLHKSLTTVVKWCSLFFRIFHFRSLTGGFLDQELWFDQTSFTPLWCTMKVSMLLFCQCCIVFESLLNNDVCGNINILYTEFIWIKHAESCVRVDIHSVLTLYWGVPWVAITSVKGLLSHHNVAFKSLNLETCNGKVFYVLLVVIKL